jgi:putative transposase
MVFRFDEEEESKAFWQRRFYDFNVWGEKKLKQKLDYMHRNPVDRELAKHPRDWPWSSWNFYEGNGKGLIPIDITREREREKQSQNPHP